MNVTSRYIYYLHKTLSQVHVSIDLAATTVTVTLVLK